MEAFLGEIIAKYNYWIYVVLMMIGFYAMIGKRNLVKKLLGMNIFQTAIILFFVSIGVKKGGGIPIVDKYQALAGGVDAATGELFEVGAGGFLDGAVGLQLCMLQSFFVTLVKQGRLWEMEHGQIPNDEDQVATLPFPTEKRRRAA